MKILKDKWKNKSNDEKKQLTLLIAIGIVFLIVLVALNIINGNTMEQHTIIYVFIYALGLSLFVYKEKKSLLSINTLFLLMYSLMFGLSPLFYLINNNSFLVHNNSIITNQYLFCVIGLIVFILGTRIPFKRKKTVEQSDKDVNMKNKYNYYIALFLIIVSTISNAIYILTNANNFFSGDLESSRISATSNSGLILLISGLNMLGNALLFDYCVKTGKKKKILIVSIVLYVFIYIIRGSRTPILRLFIIFALIYNKKKKISIKTLLLLFSFIVLLIPTLQIVRSYLSGESITFIKTLFNNLQVGSVNFNYIYEKIPSEIPFQYGSTFLINIKMLLPGSDPDFTLWLKDVLGLSYAGGGLTPTIFGEGYINFGVIGGYVEILVMGLISNVLTYNYKNKNECFWSIYFSVILLDVFRGGFANVQIPVMVTLILFVTSEVLYKKIKEKEIIIKRLKAD